MLAQFSRQFLLLVHTAHVRGCGRSRNEAGLDYERRVRADADRLQEELYRLTGSPATTFAYPYGYYDSVLEGLMEEIGFIQAYVFKYSPRPGTRAALMEDNVPDAVKLERNNLLLADLEKRSLRRNTALIGTRQQVLTEGVSPRNPLRWSGRTPHGRTVIFHPEEGWRPGEIREIEIGSASAMSLFAKGVRD